MSRKQAMRIGEVGNVPDNKRATITVHENTRDVINSVKEALEPLTGGRVSHDDVVRGLILVAFDSYGQLLDDRNSVLNDIDDEQYKRIMSEAYDRIEATVDAIDEEQLQRGDSEE